LSEVSHPKYGLKFECFECGIKFYAMGKPEPTCPKCGADQRARPRDEPKTPAKPKRAAVRPMAPLLDDDDEVASDVDAQASKTVVDEMFDDLEAVASEDQDEVPKPKGDEAS
jgi:predicted  nucleic acid-binding Zn-ribbon protein